MVRDPCCEKPGLKKGPWTPEEDHKLMSYIQTHGHSSWRALPKQAGLARCGKSCRLRWTNYLRPGIKRGNFSTHEENFIIHLHSLLGNRWSTIATHLPGRTDNEIKNHWNTRLRKRLLKMGIDPMTHRPWPPHHHHQQPHYISPPPNRTSTPSIPSFLLSLLQQPHASHQADASPATSALADPSTLLKSLLLNAAASSSSPPPLSATLAPAAAAPPLPLPTTFSSTNPPIDPSFLASVETRLILDCLKLSSNSHHEISHSPDHQLNQLITRLLLIKLLQQGTSNAAGSAHHGAALSCPAPPTSMDNSKPPMQQHILEQYVNSTLCGSMDPVLYNQGLQSLMLGGNVSHVQGSGTSAQSASTTFISPDFPAQLSNPSHNGGGIPTSVLSNMGNSSYQQRLLQAFPFLAETVFEPCSSNAVADDLSSNQLRHVNAAPPPISSPPSSVSLPSQPPPPLYWPGTTAGLSNTHTMTSGAPLLAGMPATLMAWEELLTKGGEREFNASSSTGNTSSSSTLSSASHAATAATATPSTPSNNSINVQDYWSNLLNIISPHNNHTHNC